MNTGRMEKSRTQIVEKQVGISKIIFIFGKSNRVP